MQIQKLKLGQQNNDEGSINLAGANKKATLKCKKIVIKTLAKLYESVYCHSTYKLLLKKIQWFLGKACFNFHKAIALCEGQRNDLDPQYSHTFITQLVVCIYQLSGHWLQ